MDQDDAGHQRREFVRISLPAAPVTVPSVQLMHPAFDAIVRGGQ
jgi:hypothetical protein